MKHWLSGLAKIVPLVLLITHTSVFSQSMTNVESNEPDTNQKPKNQAGELRKGHNEYGGWIGGSFHSPSIIGTAKDRKVFISGIRYGRIFATTKNVAYEYTVDLIPAAVVFQPKYVRPFSQDKSLTIYAAGISPIGFQFIFNRQKRVRPFTGLSGGFLYSRRPLPLDIPEATKFNFTFDFGGGVQFSTRANRVVTVGYKFHHLSNAGRSYINPGLDSNVFYIGFSVFK